MSEQVKVQIRPLKIEDAKISYKWRNDKEVFAFTGNTYDHEITYASELEWIERVINKQDDYRCAILVDDVYVGNIYLTGISDGQAEYHIFIGDKNYWGKSIAKQASRLIIDYARDILKLSRIVLEVKQENIRAIRLYESLGFVKTNQCDDVLNMCLEMKMVNEIYVAIHCLVYNHESYLRDCFDGFVMQKTNFPFCAVVHDDASTDNSAAIIREYAEKYPNIFRPIYETENQWSKHDGTLDKIMNEAIDATGAKYIAFCEGDDYWTDPYKLQKQVNILEADETLMACCTDCSVVNNNSVQLKEKRGGVVKDDIPGRYNLRDFFRDNHQYPTLSVVYRNTHSKEVREKHLHTENAFLGDWTLWICLLIYGDMFYLNEVTCAYRINPTSVTHTVNRVERAKASREICRNVADILPEQYSDIAADLRDTRWVWISLIFAYKAEKRYFGMIGAIFMSVVKCPKALWHTWKNRMR